MLNKGIEEGNYEGTEDNTLDNLDKFQSFLYQNFKNYKNYEQMRSTSNQPSRIYGTAKPHKFENPDNITLEQLKLRPIIAQNGTYTYNAAQVIVDYLKPLISHNDYIIKNTQDFPEILKVQPPLAEDEEYISCNVVSLFTNILIHGTIDCIIKKIYVEKKLPNICTKLIFKRLLLTLVTKITFMFQNQFYKQIDGCTMGGPLSVIFSDIFMTKLEDDVVRPLKSIFNKRFVDDTFNRRQKNNPDHLFNVINEYHKKIKYTIEQNPTNFLDTKLIRNENS